MIKIKTIKFKLYLILSFLVFLVAGIVSLSYIQSLSLAALNDESSRRYQEAVKAMEIKELSDHLYVVIADSIINRDLAESSKLWNNAKTAAINGLDLASELADTEDEQKNAQNAKASLTKMIDIYENELLPMLKSTNEISSEIRELDHNIDIQREIISEELMLFAGDLVLEAEEALASYQEAQLKHVITNILVGTASGFILTVILLLFILDITKLLAFLVTYGQKMAQGDFSQQLPEGYIKRKDEIGSLVKVFDIITNNTKNLVTQISQSAKQVAASTEELTNGAGQFSQAAGSVALSAQEVAQGAEGQVKLVAKTVKLIEKVLATIHDVVAKTNNVANLAAKTAANTNEGQNTIFQIIGQMDSINSSNKQVEKTVNRVSESSKRINEIVNMITAVADQTNLLALNAAIEAARAGELGKGFAVVAEEVRKLAEQSQEATKEITILINENHENIVNATNSVTTASNEVEEGLKVMNVAGQVFSEIAKLANEVSIQVQETENLMEEITSNSKEMGSAIMKIDNVSQEVQSEIMSVSAATEEQTASAEEIAGSIEVLAELAKELQILVSKFKV